MCHFGDVRWNRRVLSLGTADRIVSSMFVPVSPSGTGKTFSELTFGVAIEPHHRRLQKVRETAPVQGRHGHPFRFAVCPGADGYTVSARLLV